MQPALALASLKTLATTPVLLSAQTHGAEAGIVGGLLCFFIFAMIINLVGLVFWVWMIVDCATKEPSEGNDKLIWILVIVLTNWLGALVYFLVRRPKRIRQYGQ